MPRDIITIAQALKMIYEKVYEGQNDLTEMKMHKLLYFAQKRHYANFGQWLFEDDFEGWVHGPVNRRIRTLFYFLDDDFDGELTPEEEYTIREVVYDYGKYSASELRNLSHEEYAYKVSREGLNDDEPGDRIILKENIIKDISNHEQETFF